MQSPSRGRGHWLPEPVLSGDVQDALRSLAQRSMADFQLAWDAIADLEAELRTNASQPPIGYIWADEHRVSRCAVGYWFSRDHFEIIDVELDKPHLPGGGFFAVLNRRQLKCLPVANPKGPRSRWEEATDVAGLNPAGGDMVGHRRGASLPSVEIFVHQYLRIAASNLTDKEVGWWKIGRVFSDFRGRKFQWFSNISREFEIYNWHLANISNYEYRSINTMVKISNNISIKNANLSDLIDIFGNLCGFVYNNHFMYSKFEKMIMIYANINFYNIKNVNLYKFVSYDKISDYALICGIHCQSFNVNAFNILEIPFGEYKYYRNFSEDKFGRSEKLNEIKRSINYRKKNYLCASDYRSSFMVRDLSIAIRGM